MLPKLVASEAVPKMTKQAYNLLAWWLVFIVLPASEIPQDEDVVSSMVSVSESSLASSLQSMLFSPATAALSGMVAYIWTTHCAAR